MELRQQALRLALQSPDVRSGAVADTDKAAELIARGLMQGDASTLKAGYSQSNAVRAAVTYVLGATESFKTQLARIDSLVSNEPDSYTVRAVEHLRTL